MKRAVVLILAVHLSAFLSPIPAAAQTSDHAAAAHHSLRAATVGSDAIESIAIPGNWRLLLPAVLPAGAGKNDGNGDRKLISSGLLTPRRAVSPFHTLSAFGGIGSVEAFGEYFINGRASRDRQLIWNGETLQAPSNGGARAAIDGIGLLSLAAGTIVKLTAAQPPASSRVLVAELIRGNVTLHLDAAARAVLHSPASAYASSPGAAFRARTHDGQTSVEPLSGQVFDLGNWTIPEISDSINAVLLQGPQTPQVQTAASRYAIRPVNLGYNTSVRARGTRQIQVQVTDENDKPVPDLPVLFLLGRSGGVGSLQGAPGEGLSFSTTTNDQGIATADFLASEILGAVSVRVTIPGANSSWNGLIVVTRPTPGFWTPQTAVPVLATVGAVVVAGITVVNRQSRGPAEAPGPPVVRP